MLSQTSEHAIRAMLYLWAPLRRTIIADLLNGFNEVRRGARLRRHPSDRQRGLSRSQRSTP